MTHRARIAGLGLGLGVIACGPPLPGGSSGSDTGDPVLDGAEADEPDDTGPGEPDPGDGDGDGDGDEPPSTPCNLDSDCASGNCYVVPFLGGYCGECNEDSDCEAGGCTVPNPFDGTGSTCNTGELGGGCETSEVCQPGLVCAQVIDLLGLIVVQSCGECTSDADCGGLLCAPQFEFSAYAGHRACIVPGSLGQDSFCELSNNGDQACQSGVCSTVDVGLTEVGACGQCNTDMDCNMGQTCQPGELLLDDGTLTGSSCV